MGGGCDRGPVRLSLQKARGCLLACGPKFTDSWFRLKDFKGQCADRWAASGGQTRGIGASRSQRQEAVTASRAGGAGIGGGVSCENGAVGGTRTESGQGRKTHFFPPHPQVFCASAVSDPVNGQRQGAGGKPCGDSISEHRVWIRLSKGSGEKRCGGDGGAKGE